VASTPVVIVTTKGDIATIVVILLAVPSMPLLLSYLCHIKKHCIAAVVTTVDCCVWVM
jgi:hypothetical protein